MDKPKLVHPPAADRANDGPLLFSTSGQDSLQLNPPYPGFLLLALLSIT